MDIDEMEALQLYREIAENCLIYTIYHENGDIGKVIIPYRSFN